MKLIIYFCFREIETKCQRVLKKLNYEIFDPDMINSTVVDNYNQLLKQIEVDHENYMNFKEKNNLNS